MTKPNLFLIGAPKAGTTSVHQYLGQHPDIACPDPKKPHYFIQGDLGGQLDWIVEKKTLADYNALYETASQSRYRVDGSTWYLAAPSTPRRVKEYNPEAKIIAILRQPVARDYSDFLYTQRDGRTFVGADFKAIFAECTFDYAPNRYLSFLSNYSAQVKNWRRYFTDDSFRVLLFDDFVRDEKAIMADVFQWLGLDPSKATYEKTHANQSSLPKNPLARRLANEAKGPFRQLYSLLLPRSLRRLIRQRVVEADAAPPPLPDEVRIRLTERYHPMIAELEDLLDRDLSHWRS